MDVITIALIGYVLIGGIIAYIVAEHDKKRGDYSLYASLLGGVIWPVTLLLLLVGTKRLKEMHDYQSKLYDQKQVQQNYRDKTKRKR